jgi:hypothetical protein
MLSIKSFTATKNSRCCSGPTGSSCKIACSRTPVALSFPLHSTILGLGTPIDYLVSIATKHCRINNLNSCRILCGDLMIHHRLMKQLYTRVTFTQPIPHLMATCEFQIHFTQSPPSLPKTYSRIEADDDRLQFEDVLVSRHLSPSAAEIRAE